jgi:hypothetical protein
VEGLKDGTGDKAEEAKIGFLVADGQAPISLDPAKEHLDAPAQGIELLVIVDGNFSVLAPRNDRNVVIGAQHGTVVVTVITHILDHVTAEHLGGQRIGHRDVGDVAAGQLAFDHAISGRDGQMQLGGYARAISATRAVPPFEPPP